MAPCLLFILISSTLDAQEKRTVIGQVVNETLGASINSELAIMLHVLDQDSGQFATLETTTNSKGEFQFKDVLLFNNGTYFVTADYGGTSYNTTIEPSSLGNKIKLSVYENTQDISIIRIKHHALVLVNVDPRKQLATAATFISLTNDTDLTVLPDLENVGPGRFSFLRFSLPPDPHNLDVQSSLVGSQIIPVGSGFAIAAPIMPGTHDISFSYEFRYQGTDLTYKHSVLQGADVFQVLIPQSLGEIQVGLINSTTSPSVSNESYRIWEVRDLTPGQGPTVSLSNLPKPSLLDRLISEITNPDIWLLAIPVGMGALLILLLIWSIVLSLRNHDPLPTTTSKAELLLHSSADRDRLIYEIALLDDRHAKGLLSQTTYLETRSVLIDEVLTIDASLQPVPIPRNSDFNEPTGERSK